MPDIITWYDMLGLTAGASPDTLRSAYEERLRQLAPRLFSSAPSPVLVAATRAREAAEAAWLVLGDDERRRQYDKDIGMYRRRGGGFSSGPAEYVGDPYDAMRTADGPLHGDFLADFAALASWMAPLPDPPRRRLTVPDMRGLFYQACRAIVTMAGLRLTTERLTADPMPVEGLVIGQSLPPGSTTRRGSMLTVQLWHPTRS